MEKNHQIHRFAMISMVNLGVVKRLEREREIIKDIIDGKTSRKLKGDAQDHERWKRSCSHCLRTVLKLDTYIVP